MKVKVTKNILEITVVYFNTREKKVKVKISKNVLEITCITISGKNGLGAVHK